MVWKLCSQLLRLVRYGSRSRKGCGSAFYVKAKIKCNRNNMILNPRTANIEGTEMTDRATT